MEMSFPALEFESRHAKLRSAIERAGLDALILTRAENIFYGSGFRASHFASWLCELHALVIPKNGEPRLMTRALERETAKLQWTKTPVLYMDHEDPYVALRKILEESGNTKGKIGIEERYLKVSQMKKIAQQLPDAEYVDVTGLVERVAATPSKAESACMQKSAEITKVGFQAGIDAVKEGAYPYQIIGKIHDAMYQAGQRDFDMSLVCVWSGPGGGRMHDTYTAERIKHGDLVTIEVWGVDTQYKTGAQGSIYVGREPPAEIAQAYELTAAMHNAAAKAVKAGVTAGSVFEAANRVYRAARGSDYYRRCGASMGLAPFTTNLGRNNDEILQPGVAFLVQTLVDDPVLLTCASTVMVTETGQDELVAALPTLRTTG